MKGYIFILLTLCMNVLNAQSDSTASDDFDFSVITVQKPGFRIYSDAYTYYNAVPRRIGFLVDTTSFDARWESLDYCRTTRKATNPQSTRIRNAYFRVRLTRNNVNNKLCFKTAASWGVHDFTYYMRFRRPVVVNMVNLYPETRPFRMYEWIVYDDITRKEFRRMMQGKRWYDIRIEHEEGDEYFTMILKGSENRVSINVHPFINMKMINEERHRPDLDRLYRNYAKSLDKQRKKFDSRLERNMRFARNNGNPDLYKMVSRYFSAEEKEMDREEWTEYYQQIILNESSYIATAPFYPSIFTRHLAFTGYRTLMITPRSNTPANRFRLSDEAITSPPVSAIFINRNSLWFYNQGTVRSASNNAYFSDILLNDELVVVLVMKDGTIGIGDNFSPDPETGEYIINLETYKPELLTIGAIAEILGL